MDSITIRISTDHLLSPDEASDAERSLLGRCCFCDAALVRRPDGGIACGCDDAALAEERREAQGGQRP